MTQDKVATKDSTSHSLGDDAINLLLARLDELTRWRPGSKGQYLDLHSALERIQGEANHVVTGRRGSGKTRLLDELRAVAETKAFRVVSIGAEDYKELTYPDILIQILRSFLHQFFEELTPQRMLFSSEWYKQLYAWLRHPIKEKEKSRSANDIRRRVEELLTDLDIMLKESDELDAEYFESRSDQSDRVTSASVNGVVHPGSMDANVSQKRVESKESNRRAKQKEQKRIKVERLLGDFKRLLRDFCKHFDAKVVLAVDDFYFIRREDQPKVIDYMHRICKDTKSFLKVATIKHRTALFEHAGIARGVVAGHEIQSIDLELPLGEFELITRFLSSIWKVVCQEVDISAPDSLFIGDGLEQAVLASGGVPRDFFGIVNQGLLVARERRERGIGKRRINEAARIYAEKSKMPELHIDIARDQGLIELLLFDIVRFTREEKRKNCFLINLDPLEASSDLRHLFDALADSRLIHLISDNTSSTRRYGRYAAYLLDVGLYGHPERRGERAIDEVKFWNRDPQGRLMNLSRAPIYPVRSMSALEDALAGIRKKGIDIRTFILEPETEEEASKSRELQLQLPFQQEVVDE